VYYHSDRFRCGEVSGCKFGVLYFILSELLPIVVPQVQMDSTCAVQERSEDTMTPRYLNLSTCLSGTPSSKMTGRSACCLFLDTIMYLHLTVVIECRPTWWTL